MIAFSSRWYWVYILVSVVVAVGRCFIAVIFKNIFDRWCVSYVLGDGTRAESYVPPYFVLCFTTYLWSIYTRPSIHFFFCCCLWCTTCHFWPCVSSESGRSNPKTLKPYPTSAALATARLRHEKGDVRVDSNHKIFHISHTHNINHCIPGTVYVWSAMRS